MADHLEVVTRYGGHRHLTRHSGPDGRHFTLCRGTSAWSLESWAETPDHPLGLTVDAMRELPVCPRCEEVAALNSPAERGVRERFHRLSEHRLAALLEAEKFVRDVAASGVRADVNPTIGGVISRSDDVTGWYAYIAGIDSNMRRRALKVLATEPDSRNAADAYDDQGPDDALTTAGYRIVRADELDSATDPTHVKTWNFEQEDLFRRTWATLRTAPLMGRGRGAGKSTALRELSRRIRELAFVDHDEHRRRLGLADPEPESPGHWRDAIAARVDLDPDL